MDGLFNTSAGTEHELFPYWMVDLEANIWVSSIALTNRNNVCELSFTEYTLLGKVQSKSSLQ